MNDHDLLRPATRRTPATDDVVQLYHRAFDLFGIRALWNIVQVEHPTNEQVLAIARQLRTEGNMDARRLAERIEEATRAHL